MKILNQHFCVDVNLDVGGVDVDVDMETDNNNNTNNNDAIA